MADPNASNPNNPTSRDPDATVKPASTGGTGQGSGSMGTPNPVEGAGSGDDKS
jgi:hypothetical protein